jgi:hypothetical protein
MESRYRREFEKILKADRDDDGGGGSANDHHASKLADLLFETGRFDDRAHALRYLFHNKDGAALLARLNMHKRDNEPMEAPVDRPTQLRKIAKEYGVLKIASDVVDRADAFGITEHELVEMIGEYDRQPGESTAKCFARHFERQDEVGLTLRKAVQVAKSWPAPMSLEPMVSGGSDAFPKVQFGPGRSSPGIHDDDRGVGEQNAYAQLMKLVEQQKRAGETQAAAFERIYLDPANRHLAEAERAQNRPTPTTNYPFPR